MEEEFAKRQKLDALAALIGGATAGEDGVLRVSAPAMAAAEAAPIFPTFAAFPPAPAPEPSKPRKHHAGLFSDEGGIQGWLEQERARRRRSRDKRVPERD